MTMNHYFTWGGGQQYELHTTLIDVKYGELNLELLEWWVLESIDQLNEFKQGWISMFPIENVINHEIPMEFTYNWII